MYREGIGVEISKTKAELWLGRAAKNGIRRAAAHARSFPGSAVRRTINRQSARRNK